ncbi:4'-phosphopantetheinyl transferase family protein [Nocardia sp. NPDC059177]|uniref:4'-phosphopantetheinyl transferase family protein n=1 Tax=Nocardia sp. NPDC059177 TaxID=3346759 RepID=UPI003686D652
MPTEARRAFAAAHALARHALSWCAPRIDPSEWRLSARNPHGRPEVSAPRLDADIRVNLSHTDGMVAVVATLTDACGIDIERRADSAMVSRVAHRVLSATELATMRDLDPAARTDQFCRLWTLKEATTKALGTGLRTPFDTIAFDFDDDRNARRADNDPSWSMRSWPASPEHHVSVAVHAPKVDFVVHSLSEELRARNP